ncbi:phosphate signaling complex protein PhoU [Corynebacterium lizhenjunii]|uniref:Phosphate signaling complex protein PhoU n=1 Tax=Corynebacterium lizhenjunii TaxID=2709394 RepID=A0A7T0PBT4_9CORY|nr:phosphate signaling complex protein PhoU [Corynebacterium lizhenjunii]QPK78872.1 phosphate signaling complex protein PhoU [Corynebacterium lizhenjunii]
MRAAYREHLDNFSHDLIVMCDTVRDMLTLASQGLLHSDLQKAEETLSLKDELEETRARCESRAVTLLALENPMGKDLRQVVSSIYIVEDLFRMGQLVRHVANTARRRHPECAVPEEHRGFFEEMFRICLQMVAQTRDILIEPDPEVAIAAAKDDDAIDDINEHIIGLLTMREWGHTTRQAVDMALLSRFYERFADHAVSVNSRVVFLVTGLAPEQYLAKKDEDAQHDAFEARFEALERQFRR